MAHHYWTFCKYLNSISNKNVSLYIFRDKSPALPLSPEHSASCLQGIWQSTLYCPCFRNFISKLRIWAFTGWFLVSLSSGSEFKCSFIQCQWVFSPPPGGGFTARSLSDYCRNSIAANTEKKELNSVPSSNGMNCRKYFGEIWALKIGWDCLLFDHRWLSPLWAFLSLLPCRAALKFGQNFLHSCLETCRRGFLMLHDVLLDLGGWH
jgi:hypothetical protein